MKIAMTMLSIAFLAGACASKSKHDAAGLEKYPQCYHKNVKISNTCIEKNNAGESVTASQLENTAYPGQYN